LELNLNRGRSVSTELPHPGGGIESAIQRAHPPPVQDDISPC